MSGPQVPTAGLVVALGLAVVAIGLAVGGRRGRTPGVLVAVALVVAVALGAAGAGLLLVSDRTTAGALAAAGVLVVAAAAFGWHGAPASRRAGVAAAAVLLAAVALGALVGPAERTPAPPFLTAAALSELRAEAAASGHLPAHGVVMRADIPAEASHFETTPAVVYLPPAWFATPRPNLPALMLLPGEPGTASDWVENGGAASTADRFATAHDGRAPIIVMPDPNGTRTDDSECVNSAFGNAETYLVRDVPAYLHRVLGAASGPGALAVGGLSAGGTCSVVLALRNPGVFSTFASYSGFGEPIYQDDDRAQTIEVLFGGSAARFSAHDPATLLETHRYPDLAGWFEDGEADPVPLAATRRLVPLARAAGVEVCQAQRPGGHDYSVWRAALSDSLPWIAGRLGLSSEPERVPAECASG